MGVYSLIGAAASRIISEQLSKRFIVYTALLG